MRNQVEKQVERYQETSIQEILFIICLQRGLRKTVFKIIYSKLNSITFYSSHGMRNQFQTQRQRSQGTSIQPTSVDYLPRRGGGLRKLGFKIIFSKSNSITFYRSLGMRNQVETQRERSQGNSIQQNYMYYLPRGWPENNRGENNLLQIQFYHVQ